MCRSNCEDAVVKDALERRFWISQTEMLRLEMLRVTTSEKGSGFEVRGLIRVFAD